MRKSYEVAAKAGEEANAEDVRIRAVNSKESAFQNYVSEKSSDVEIGHKNLSYQESDKKPSILLMKNEWTTYSSVGVQRKILEENTEIIKDFMNSLAVPSWYRGVSVFQKKAADLLRNAIRDDYAQRTVYRTMKCLESIGLDPLPTKKQLQTLLPLCGGSDLALLWFLKEWLYRDKDSDSYSVNEQLIMSSIAHLDMFATLQELDRILPPKPDIQTEVTLRRRMSLKNKSKKSSIKENYKTLPYFEKLPQRIPTKRRSIKVQQSPKPSLDLYPQDSSLAVANGNHRWAQSNIFEDQDRPVHNIEINHVSRLLEQFEAAMAEESQVSEMHGIEYLKKSYNNELDAIAKQRTDELEQIFERKDQNYKRSISRLQNDIEKYRHEFYKMAENYQSLFTGILHGPKDIRDSALFSNNCDIQMGRQSFNRCGTIEEDEGGKKDTFSKSNTQQSETTSESDYFVFSQNQQPLKFDYCKIFACESRHTEQIKILNNENIRNHTDNCVRTKCQQSVARHGIKEIKTTEKDDTGISVVDYGLDYYDPEDDELMDRMLRDALDIMKKDHRFVFASIPAAHRFPRLHEWIRLRYGKTFKRKELSRCFQQSKPIFRALAKVGLPVELPSNNDMGSNLITNYSCRDYVIQKSRHIRNQFYDRIDKAMLAQSRVIYFAMRHCSSDQPYNTIFAYMPAHKRENYHFRPWKLGESLKRIQLRSFEPANEIKPSKRMSNKSELT